MIKGQSTHYETEAKTDGDDIDFCISSVEKEDEAVVGTSNISASAAPVRRRSTRVIPLKSSVQPKVAKPRQAKYASSKLKARGLGAHQNSTSQASTVQSKSRRKDVRNVKEVKDEEDEPLQTLASRMKDKEKIKSKSIQAKGITEKGRVFRTRRSRNSGDEIVDDREESKENDEEQGSDWDPDEFVEDDEEEDEDDWKPTQKKPRRKKKITTGKAKESKQKRVDNEEKKEDENAFEKESIDKRGLSHLIETEDREDGTKLYKCTLCPKTFDILRSLYQHLRSHGNKEQYHKCEICKKEFAYEGGLTLHMKLHTEGDESLFKCSICSRTFLRKCDLEKHEVRHFAKYPCRYCDKEFPKEKFRMRHERQHTGEKIYKCNKCDRTFASHGGMLSHYRKHSGVRPACEFCGMTFSDTKVLDNHRRQKHTREKLQYCEKCGKGFTTRSTLLKHMQMHDPDRERPFSCTLCSKSYITTGGLRLHMENIHEEKRTYIHKCEICSRSFNTPSNLKYHLDLHSGKTPYNCSTCDKSFKTKQKLQSHSKIHSKKHEKTSDRSKLPFPCNVEGCLKGYTHVRYLKRHERECHSNYESENLGAGKCHRCPTCTKETPLIQQDHYGLGKNPHVHGYLCNLCGVVLRHEEEMSEHVLEKHC